MLIIILHIGVCGQYIGTVSLRSSLEGTNRKFACPGERIALTCSVSGTALRWDAEEEGDSQAIQIANLGQNNSGAGSDFSERYQFTNSCNGSITFTGALDRDYPGVDSSQWRNSSMTVTPGSENALHCAPLTITCIALSGGENKAVVYQIAGESLYYCTLNQLSY